MENSKIDLSEIVCKNVTGSQDGSKPNCITADLQTRVRTFVFFIGLLS